MSAWIYDAWEAGSGGSDECRAARSQAACPQACLWCEEAARCVDDWDYRECSLPPSGGSALTTIVGLLLLSAVVVGGLWRHRLAAFLPTPEQRDVEGVYRLTEPVADHGSDELRRRAMGLGGGGSPLRGSASASSLELQPVEGERLLGGEDT